METSVNAGEENNAYHVYNRGVAKLPVFLGHDDYHDFQDILRYLLIGFPEVSQTSSNSSNFVATQYSMKNFEKLHLPITYKADPQSNGLFRQYIDLLAYCLMPNHFHLLLMVTNPEGTVKRADGSLRNFQSTSEFTKRLLITFAHKFNYRHNRVGAVFQGRTKIKPVVSDEYVVQVARYIHLNPTTAGLVQEPEQWPYSDFHLYHSPRSLRNFQFTKPRFILDYFDKDPKEYADFVKAGIEPDEASAITPFTIDSEEND